MSKKTENQHIQVFARCRPLEQSESHKDKVVEVVQDKKVLVTHKGFTKAFSFDKAFDSNAKQIDVYKAVVEPLIEEVLMGFNCTVFAYGQTGTGKTYTMEGERTNTEYTWERDPAAGIIPRSMHQIFDALHRGKNSDFSVKVSYLELYNEEIFDLLSDNDAKIDKSKIRLYDSANKNGSVITQGLEEVHVNNKDEVYAILQRGTARRKTAATQCNINSSRSHAVFSVTVHMKENTIEGEDLLKIGKLNLVDLAGSESVKTSGAIDKRLREAGNINQSLLTLGRVITALIEKTPHIPYRESKLTRLLQDSLGGHTKTSIIATISPSSSCIEETLNTLDYATKAKSITVKPQVNQKTIKRALLKEYCEEIERVKKELDAARKGDGFYVTKENYLSMEERIINLSNANKELTDDREDFIEIRSKLEEQLSSERIEHQKTNEEHFSTVNTLKKTQMTLSKVMVERDENKYVATSHEIKNKKLFEQATTLNSVLDQASEDNSKLHSKLDRKRTLEMTNEQKTQEFQEDFKLQTDQTVNIVNEMEDKQYSFHKKTSEDLYTLGEIFKRCNELSQTCIGGGTETKSQLHALSTDLNNRTESHLHWINDTIQNIIEEKESSLNEQNYFTSVTLPAIFEELKQKVNESHCWLMDKFKEQEQKQLHLKDSESSQQAEKLELHCKTISLYDNSEQRLESLLEKLENQAHQLSGSYAAKKAARNNQIDQLETRQNKLQQIVERMSAELINMSKELSEVSTELSNLKQQDDSQFSEMEQNHKSEISEISNTIRKVVSTLKEEKQSIAEEASSKHQELLLSLKSVATGNISLLKNIETISTKTSDKYIKDLEHHDSAVSEDLQNLESQITKIKQSLESQQDAENLLHSEILSLPQISDRLVATSSEAASDISASAQQIKEALINSDSAVVKFLNQELVKDQPTGATPQRTTYNRPESLIQLSPDNRIRHRFQMQHTEDVLPPTLSHLDSAFYESDELQNSKEDSNFLSVPHTNGSVSTGGESDSNLSETSEANVEVNNVENLPKSKKRKFPPEKILKSSKKNKFTKPASIQISQSLGTRNTDLKSVNQN